MKTRFLRKTMAVAFISAFAAYSVQASAISLAFDQNSGFKVDTTLVSNDGASPNNDIVWYDNSDAPAGTFGTIAWGLPNNSGGLKGTDPFLGTYSGLKVVGYAGSLTDSVWTSISSIFHVNTEIPSNAFVLQSADIYSDLTLESIVNGNTVSIVSFAETSNNGLSNCLAPNPEGSNCDDLFTFDLVDFQSVYLGGNLWLDFRFLDVTDATTLCEGNICKTYTAEGVTSQLDVQGRLREIPEPATLVLMGLGLLGLAGLKKRAKV